MHPEHRPQRVSGRARWRGRVRWRLGLAVVIPLLSIALGAMLLPKGMSSAATTAAAAPGAGWSPAAIIQVAEQGTGQVVIAHRGVYAAGCPENSLCSIQQAYTDGMEGIELDVKQSAEGTPWLFHEQNAGRLIAHTPAFNPFQNANPPAGWDPTIASMTDSELSSSYLNDKNLDKTSYQPLTLDAAFAAIKNNGWNHMLIMLDLKSLDAVQRAATLAIHYGLQDAVVLKFSSSLLAASTTAHANITQYTKGLFFVPTVYAGDMANIMQDGWSYSFCNEQSTLATAQCTVEQWIRDLQKTPGYAWLEVGNKDPVSSDPTDFLLNAGLGSIGGFQPVPEYPNKTGTGQSYVRSNGTCCANLSDYLTPANKWFPAETVDDRENISNLLNSGMTSVITDDPTAAEKAMSKRDTTLYTGTTNYTGQWVGTYSCDQGLTGLTLDIESEPNGSATATFNFYATSSNPNVPSGAFTMTGSDTASTIQLSPGQWIHQPSGYELVSLSGTLSSDGTTLSGTIGHQGCHTFSITKQD